jgi:hypothetical protein
MESGSLPVCFPALPDRKDPRHFPSAVSLARRSLARSRVAPSVRVRLSMPVNPDAKHSHHPRYPSLAPVRGHCGLSAAAVEDAGVIRAARNRRFGCTGAAPGGARSGKRGWCSPFTRRRRRRRRRVRVRVAQHSGQSAASLPSPQKRHSESVTPRSRLQRACCSASPSRRQGCRRRVRYANTLFDPPAADRRHPVTTFPRAVFATLTCLQVGPRRACFVLRRRAGPRSLRKLVCAGVAAARLRGRTLRVLTLQPTTTPIYPKTDKTPDQDPDASRLPRHPPGAFTPRCTGRATARARCHARL